MLSGDPIVVKEEPDDGNHHNPAVNVEPPADDHGEDEESEDLAGEDVDDWRPDLGRLRASVAEMEGSESGDEEKDATKKGTKRKRAPPTKGPCEHGVKPRSQCKVCSACPHGRLRTRCKECGGACVHSRHRPRCKECGGSVHSRRRYRCKECGGSGHGRRRNRCKECGTAVTAVCALSAGGSQSGGASARPCALVSRKECVELICVHGRQRSKCKECGGSGICVHGRGALSARSAAGALCVHGRVREKSAAGHHSACTAVGAPRARSAVGLNLRARPYSLCGARSAAGSQSACTAAHSLLGARSARNKHSQDGAHL